jgi:hypothetical protein
VRFPKPDNLQMNLVKLCHNSSTNSGGGSSSANLTNPSPRVAEPDSHAPLDHHSDNAFGGQTSGTRSAMPRSVKKSLDTVVVIKQELGMFNSRHDDYSVSAPRCAYGGLTYSGDDDLIFSDG